MTAFQHVIEYVSKFYRGPYELDPWRMLLVLYLADWRSALERERPVTDIKWRVADIGPVPENLGIIRAKIEATMQAPPDFSSIKDPSLAIPDNVCLLSQDESEIVDFVIERVASRDVGKLSQLVFSTFPLMTQPMSAPLNLVALAKKYKAELRHHS